MKTKLEIAIDALSAIGEWRKRDKSRERLTPTRVLGNTAHEAIKEIKAMPDENCGTCKYYGFFMVIGGVRKHYRCNNKLGLKEITEEDFCSRHEAHKEIKAMPDENCGSCRFNNKSCTCSRDNCCNAAGKGLKDITDTDYCSRWKVREKLE